MVRSNQLKNQLKNMATPLWNPIVNVGSVNVCFLRVGTANFLRKSHPGAQIPAEIWLKLETMQVKGLFTYGE